MKAFVKIFIAFISMANVMPGFAARTTVARQNVINVGTSVAESSATTSSSCQEKYDACMDAGCMIDNDNGGRCQCSNQIKDLNEQLKQIEKDFKTSVDLQNDTLDRINAGDMVNEAMSNFDNDDDEDDEDLDV